MRLFISKDEALGVGMTHEGTIFGVPVWMANEGTEVVAACAKFVPFELWLGFCSWLFDALLVFVPSNQELETPIKTKGRIS